MIASAVAYATLARSNVAPLATVVSAAVVPRASSAVIFSVPALTEVAPVYIFVPDSVKVPVPS